MPPENGNGRVTTAILGEKVDALTHAFEKADKQAQDWRNEHKSDTELVKVCIKELGDRISGLETASAVNITEHKHFATRSQLKITAAAEVVVTAIVAGVTVGWRNLTGG